MFMSDENVLELMTVSMICWDTHSLVCPDLKLTFAIGEGEDPELRVCYLRRELLGFLRHTHGHAIYLRNNYSMTGDEDYDHYEAWSPEIHGYGNDFYSRGMSDAEIADYVNTGYVPRGMDL